MLSVKIQVGSTTSGNYISLMEISSELTRVEVDINVRGSFTFRSAEEEHRWFCANLID